MVSLGGYGVLISLLVLDIGSDYIEPRHLFPTSVGILLRRLLFLQGPSHHPRNYMQSWDGNVRSREVSKWRP